LAIEDIGELLLQKILSMAFLTFLSILIFSNLVTAFSSFFLSDDLQLLNSSPVQPRHFFFARFFETCFHASWMIVIFGLPFLLAYGHTFNASYIYYLQLGVVFLPFVLIPAAIAILVALMLATIFPARRLRDMIFFLFVLGFAVIYLYLRILEPERFLDPERFAEAIEFLGMLRDPTSPFLPSDWAVASLFPLLSPNRLPIDTAYLPLTALYLTAASLIFITYWFYEWLYHEAFSRAQTGKKARYHGNWLLQWLIHIASWPFQRSTQIMLAKEFRSFLRNPGQWAQLLLLGALVIVYIFNFSSLRKLSSLNVHGIPAMFAEMGLYLFNLILLGFVISAVAVRFAYPSVSLEGRCFWLIRQSPLSMRRFLISKFWSVFIPLALLAEIIAIATNLFIRSSLTHTLLASLTVLLMTFGITGMGVGLGAIYPRFDLDNPSKIATGFGGVLYMICSMVWIAALIGIEIIPLRYVMLSQIGNTAMPLMHIAHIAIFGAFALLLTFLAYYIPMSLGVRALEKFEE
jgi:ABC-2 type transport system permease protein